MRLNYVAFTWTNFRVADHKEVWAHLLAYNLLRTVMAVAASESDTEPRKIRFKGAKQAVTAFAPKIEAARPEDRGRLIDALLKAIAYHRVGNRPGRWEPRAETSAGTSGAPDATAGRRQTAAESVEILLSERHSWCGPTRVGAGQSTHRSPRFGWETAHAG